MASQSGFIKSDKVNWLPCYLFNDVWRSAIGHDVKHDFWPIVEIEKIRQNGSMKTFIQQFNVVRLIGLTTIFTVAMVAIFLALDGAHPDYGQVSVLVWLFASFLGLELVTTGEQPVSRKHLMAAVIAQLLVLYALFFTASYNFVAILLGIWCGNLLHFMSLGRALATTPVLMFFYYAIFTWYWGFDYMLFSTPLYWMLCLFTVSTVNSWIQETLAKEASEELNRELIAAQSLLKEATRQSERTRIARDIHDLLGHHLTALTINLQVAMHKTDGEAKQQVEKSYAIAKLLLSDVREAVTEIREKSALQLKDALQALVSAVPRLTVSLNLEEDLDIQNVELADAILRCVQESLTNTLKHSHGDRFMISLRREASELKLAMSDNGKAALNFKVGNGLSGMKERILALGGSIRFEPSEGGFHTFICFREA